MELKNVKAGFDTKAKEIAELLEAREKLQKTGNTVSETDKVLNEKMEGYFYNPKKAVREKFLYTKAERTADQQKELDDLLDYKAQVMDGSYLKEFNKEFEKVFGRKQLKIVKSQKGARGFNGKIMYTDYMLPTSFRGFVVNPWNSELNPASIFQVKVRNFESAVNKQELIELVFVSILFDENLDCYKKIYWKVIAEYLDEPIVLVEEGEDDDLA